MKKYLHLLFSLALIIASVALVFVWEVYLDEKFNTVSVVVAVKNLDKNQVIGKDDVKITRIKVEQAVEKPISDLNSVIGQETGQFVAKGNQFVEPMIDRYGLEPNDDQLIYSIPREWIYASPGSLRRKDRVYIYAIPDETRFQIAAQGRAGVPAGRLAESLESEPILQNLVVAYAKDSANQEVKPAVNSDKRLDATGSINNIEMVMTQKQYSVLEEKYLKGYKFNFAYK